MVTRTPAPRRAARARTTGMAVLLAAVSTLSSAPALAQSPRASSAPQAVGTPSAVPPRGATVRSGQTRSADDPSTASRGGTRVTSARAPVQCEKCHADRQFLAGKAKGERGDSVLFVPDTLLRDSRHRTLVCADCHAGYNDGYPHATVPAVSLKCQECHDDQGAAYHRSIHAKNFDDKGDAPTCVNCHSSHRVLGADDVRSPTYPLNVARLCGSCHDKSHILDAYFDAPGDTVARSAVKDFRRSVHGLAMTQAGLTVSASCSDCHDAHRVLPHDSTESTLSRANVKGTCGACHAGLLTTYDSSAHGLALLSGDTTETGQQAPVCIECHGGHKVVDAKDPAWFADVVRECGACHQRLIETYVTTYHGKASALGYGVAAKCSDCHTAHAMLPADDPKSSVHPDNLVDTCGACHEGANANFVMYKPHGDPHDRERNPELYWVWLGMTALLVGVFSFFGVHSLLWFGRLLSVRKERQAARAHVGPGGPTGDSGSGGAQTPMPPVPPAPAPGTVAPPGSDLPAPSSEASARDAASVTPPAYEAGHQLPPPDARPVPPSAAPDRTDPRGPQA